MLAKFSVKKPMTIFVAVILVIVLGVVSFLKMTPDLLPSIDFPYVIVVTTYTGASPEKIEGTVTKPIEQSAATLDDIKQIDSTSSANFSLVMLEFNESANMDAATMNLREKLDQMAASWPDEVGSPMILKINPNMLPINVSAVMREGYDTIELSNFVTETVLPQLEGIDGVASVSLSGTISERVNVIIRQEKIDAVNQKIRAAIDEEFAEPEQELADAQEELDKGRKQIASGRSAISAGKKQLAASEAEAETQFAAAQTEIDNGRTQLETAIGELNRAIALGESYDDLAATQAELLAKPAEERTDAEKALLAELETTLPAAALANANLPQTKAALAQAQTQLAALDAAQAELDTQKETVNQELASAKKQLNSGSNQLYSASKELDNAQEQLDEAVEQLDEAKTDAYDAAEAEDFITLENVSGILGAQDFSMPAGYVTEDDVEWLVYVGDAFQTASELESLLLFDLGMEGLDPIYLTDVADVLIKDNADSTYTKINGSDGVMLTFNKQSNYATATASENILETFRTLEETYEGLHFTALMDQGDYIDLVVSSVLDNLILGAALAVLILLLFLHDIRPTFIVACSIPISLTFAIVLMYFSGVTLNVISMSGLAVGVGMLVDNSIVVIENVYRLRKSGVPAYRAAVSGAAQVTGAITASTLTTVCVFAPIVFIQGITRQLFTDMALTITYSLLASLIVALTLIPAMAGDVLRSQPKQKRTLFDRVTDLYARSLDAVLRHKAPVVVLTLMLLVVSAYSTIVKGFTFMPAMDSPQMSATITMHDDTATLKDTGAIADIVYERFISIPEVTTVGIMQSQGVGAYVGFSADASTTELEMYIMLEEELTKPSAELAAEMEAMCADLPCTVTVSAAGMDMSMLTGSGITINIYGENLDTMQRTAREVAALLETVEGVASVSDGLEETTPEFTVIVDKEKAMLEGLTTAQVYMEIATALTTETTAASIEDSGNDVVIITSEEGPSLTDVRDLVLKLTDKEGKKREVPLSDIAVFVEGETLQSISRTEQRRYLSVTGILEDGYNVTLVTEEAERIFSDYELPEGFRLEFSGENETIMEAMKDLLLMLLLGIVIVYLIMVAQFQSLLSPFIVMMTIPLAFTGGLFALLFTGHEVSIVSMIGFVLLVGVIVNNGIVLIDCMNRLRAGGIGHREATIEACRLRLRPVLMTALTTILGLIPLGFSGGIGASLIQPVAIVSIGGLTYATLMTLYIVPLFYDAWCKKAPRMFSEGELALVEENTGDAEVEELEAAKAAVSVPKLDSGADRT